MWTAPFASGFDVFERLRRHMSVFRRGASAAGPDEQPRTERRTAGATDRRRLRNAFRPNSSKPNPIQTKPDQENGLGLSWIPSSDLRLFNRLRAVQIKKRTPKMESRRHPAASAHASRPIARGNKRLQRLDVHSGLWLRRWTLSGPFDP